MDNVWAILVAGGIGNRFGGDLPKQFLPLGGKRVLDHSLDLFRSLAYLKGVVMVLPDAFLSQEKVRIGEQNAGEFRFAAGGLTRQQSVVSGLAAVASSAEWVLVHDVARPLVSPEIVRRTLEGARETGAAVCAIPVADTLKRSEDRRFVSKTVSREKLFSIQTPQAFSKKILDEALRWAETKGLDTTDEAGLVEQMGHRVKLVEGSMLNFKITRTQDLELAEGFLAHKSLSSDTSGEMRIGQGYDVHAFAEGRPLVLGGITIPFEKGLAGHSDADALLHAIGDALLGAIAAGDLGQHFPDTDPRYRGISSLKLLGAIQELVAQKGFAIINVDATLVCQRPKLAPYIGGMRENISVALSIPVERVSVKATTEEGLGFTGTMQGLAAKAIVLLKSQGSAHARNKGGLAP